MTALKVPVDTGLPSTITQPSYTKSSPSASNPLRLTVKAEVVGASVASSSLLQEVVKK